MARVLYTAHAHVTGGREDGHGRSAEGELEVDLPVDDPETAAKLIREAD